VTETPDFASLHPGYERKICLIALGTIHDMLERQPGLEALDLAQDVGDQRARIGHPGVVRRNRHARMGPQRTFHWQRLIGEDVERRPRERPIIEHRQNIGFDLERAASDVYQVCAAGVSGSKQTRISLRRRNASSCVSP